MEREKCYLLIGYEEFDGMNNCNIYCVFGSVVFEMFNDIIFILMG